MSDTNSRLSSIIENIDFEIADIALGENCRSSLCTAVFERIFKAYYKTSEATALSKQNHADYKQTGVDGVQKQIEMSMHLPTRNIPAWYTGEEEPDTYCLNFNEDAWPAALAKAAGGEREAIEFLELLIKTMFPKLTTFCPKTFASIFSTTKLGQDYTIPRSNQFRSRLSRIKPCNKITRGVFDEYDINSMYPAILKDLNAKVGIEATYELRQKVKPSLKPYVKLAMNAYASSRQHEFRAPLEAQEVTLDIYENEPENVGIYVDSIFLPVGSRPKSIPVSDELGHFKFVRQTPEITVFSVYTKDVPRRKVLKGPYFCTKISTTQFIVCGRNEAGSTHTFVYTKMDRNEPDPEDYCPDQVDMLDRIVINEAVLDYELSPGSSPVDDPRFIYLLSARLLNIRFLIESKYSFTDLTERLKVIYNGNRLSADVSSELLRTINAVQMIDSYARMTTKNTK